MKHTILLHACCAPCFTVAYEELANQYEVTAFWFNPNIFPESEQTKRLEELQRYCEKVGCRLIVGEIKNGAENWSTRVSKHIEEPEGGKRCFECIGYRLEETAKYAKKENFDAFGTTLTTSPYKNAKYINNKGKLISTEFEIEYIEADFKKNNGYLRSVNICKELNIYRQKYCGCRFSIKN